MRPKRGPTPPARAGKLARKLATTPAAPEAERPALTPRPDGRGALLTGGVPGHRGGSGRPPSAVRQAALEGAAVAIPKLLAILESRRSRTPDVIAAADKLLKYGLGAAKDAGGAMSVGEVRARLSASIDVICSALPEEEANEVLARMERVWTDPA